MRAGIYTLIITRDRALEELGDHLTAEGIASRIVDTIDEARPFLSLERPDQCVAVLDADLPPDLTFQIYELLHDAQPIPTLMLIPPARYAHFVLDPRRPALDDYLTKPVKLEELLFRLKALMARAGFEARQAPSEAPKLEGLRHGKLMAVFSAKGGAGKTTIAASLGVGLASLYQRKTMLVDADLWFGDLGVLLDLPSDKSLAQFCSWGETDLIVALQQAVVPHASGLGVLLRPSDPFTVERLDTGTLVKMLVTAKVLFDYVVVDTRSSFDETTLQILDAADEILLVTKPEVGALHNTARYLAVAQTLGHRPKIRLVLNRANSGIGKQAVEKTLGMRASCSIVSAGPLVLEAANQGISLLEKDRAHKEPITQDLLHLLECVAGEAHPKLSRSGLTKILPFLGGRKAG